MKQKRISQQLEILSKLRNLQEEIINQTKEMAFTYDLKSDVRFKQGIDIGKNLGIDLGEERKAIIAIKNMLVDNLPLELIAKYQQVSLDFVKKVADSLQK